MKKKTISKQLEFHRSAIALMPKSKDQTPGIAFFHKEANSSAIDTLFCTCGTGKKKRCAHLKEIEKIGIQIFDKKKGNALFNTFKKSVWYQIAEVIFEHSRLSYLDIQLKSIQSDENPPLFIFDDKKEKIVTYLLNGDDRLRLTDRLTVRSKKHLFHRGEVLERLRMVTLTESELKLTDLGMKSRQLSFENTFWFRLCYHLFLEFKDRQTELLPSVNENNGTFMISILEGDKKTPVAHISVPKNAVHALLLALKKHLPNQHGMAIHPIPLKSLFKITQNTKLDIDVRPVIQVMQENGESALFDRTDLEKFRYGRLVYLKDLKIMAQLEVPGKGKSFTAPEKMTFKKYQIPKFIDTYGDALNSGKYYMDETAKSLNVIQNFDRIEITPNAMDRDWCYLGIHYGIGNLKISLHKILEAKESGQRYLKTKMGWIDLNARAFDNTETFSGFNQNDSKTKKSRMKISRLALWQLKAKSEKPLMVKGDDNASTLTRDILDIKAPRPLPGKANMHSGLRDYQKMGLQWLWYLSENRFGGLLCDDMGLGKTHQIMALMSVLRQVDGFYGPFLVVCPTTVLSHWQNKMSIHTKELKTLVYYGTDRKLTFDDDPPLVILTSYGILVRDMELLSQIKFSLTVFDEAQHLKNNKTKTHKAAASLTADLKLGLTGTPIENAVTELKSLMDIVLPGYLGNNEQFKRRYVDPIGESLKCKEKEELQKLIAPFILRRMKSSVLDELPDKIEDKRHCELSDDQVKLYRDAIEKKAKDIIHQISSETGAIPYIHIFALLSILKQICNHPAAVKKAPEDFEKYESGKWELFKELLDEAILSGQKVVVFSQYLAMIEIIHLYLKQSDIGHVTLTGASKNRGDMIHAFNNDPSIKVFVGSLKAGGTGIDLVAGSVVIHYDRWWNAAKEDQATDRVYRIGQTRGVQVFKLITSGTLEEKIDAIIEKKKTLMEDLIGEDEATVLKIFTPEEILEILTI